MLHLAPVQPLRLVVGGEVRLGLQGQAQEVFAVPPAHGFEVTADLELLQPELPDGFQHDEPGFTVGVGPADQRLVHQ